MIFDQGEQQPVSTPMAERMRNGEWHHQNQFCRDLPPELPGEHVGQNVFDGVASINTNPASATAAAQVKSTLLKI